MEGSQRTAEVEEGKSIGRSVVAVGLAGADHMTLVGKEHRAGMVVAGVVGSDRVGVVGELAAGNTLSIVVVTFDIAAATAAAAEVLMADAKMG